MVTYRTDAAGGPRPRVTFLSYKVPGLDAAGRNRLDAAALRTQAGWDHRRMGRPEPTSPHILESDTR